MVKYLLYYFEDKIIKSIIAFLQIYLFLSIH